MGWIQPMATVAYQNAKRNSTVFRRLYTAYSFWTAGDMATHQIPFQFTSFCSHCRSWLLRFFPSWRLRQQECVFCCQTQGQPALTNRRTFIARNEGAKCAHRRDYWADRWTDKEKIHQTAPLRRIAIWNDEHGYVVQLLTNNFKLSAPTIA